MKQYVIDELRPQDYEKIKAYCEEALGASTVSGIYWLPIERQFLTQLQAAHADCQPHYFVLDLAPDRLSCELLVRTQNRIRCACMAYADETQRNWLIGTMDAVLEKLEVIT